jgi:hypothetical protein
MPQVDEAQLLFQEARDRRRRRWRVSGITAATFVVLIAVTLSLVLSMGRGGTPKPAVPPTGGAVATRPAVSLSFRPVLCLASPLTLGAGQAPSPGPLPSCSPTSALTAANLGVNTSTGQSSANPPADGQFSTYASTPQGDAGNGGDVLLPAAPSQGEEGTRFVLGPAVVTQQAITAARAVQVHGQWAVNLTLSPTGASQWDKLTEQQFHAFIGIVLNGKVISAPITEPTETTFTTFAGHLQISGDFTGEQAKALAASL